MGDGTPPTEQIREVIARNLPGLEVSSIVPIGEGMDNAAWEVNGELIARRGKDTDAAARAEAVRREAALLAEVSRFSPTPRPASSPIPGCPACP